MTGSSFRSAIGSRSSVSGGSASSSHGASPPSSAASRRGRTSSPPTTPADPPPLSGELPKRTSWPGRLGQRPPLVALDEAGEPPAALEEAAEAHLVTGWQPDVEVAGQERLVEPALPHGSRVVVPVG